LFLDIAHAQTATVIPANEAAAHVNQLATVEGVVAKVFTSKSGNTFLNIGASYPNQTFTGWIPNASPVSKSPVLSGIETMHSLEKMFRFFQDSVDQSTPGATLGQS